MLFVQFTANLTFTTDKNSCGKIRDVENAVFYIPLRLEVI